METRKALDEKPYAVNPRVRFDGGWATPRYVSLVLAICAVFSAGATTISLQLDGDASFSDVLAAYNARNSTAFADTDGGTSLGANDIAVSGTGTLSFSNGLGSWTGNLTIGSGAKVRAVIGETAVLGSALQGAVYVQNGASLVLDHSVNVGDGHQVARTIHISGNGAAAGENGALKLIGNNTSFRSVSPKLLRLDADATLCFGSNTANGGQDHIFITTPDATWNLGGHTLSITGGGWPHQTVPILYYALTVSGGGHIVHDSAYAGFRNATFEGDSENSFTFRNGAKINVQQSLTPPNWTLRMENTTDPAIDIDAANSYDINSDVIRTWQGPVETALTLVMAADNVSYASVPTTIGFAGKVSGAGGIVASAPDGSDRSKKRFNLLGAGNDFTGGVAVSNETMHVGAPDSIPGGEGAGALTLANSDILLKYDTSTAANFALPDTVFHGSGQIRAEDDGIPAGSFRSLVKTGDGTLDLFVGITSGDMSVQEGTVRFQLDYGNRLAGYFGGRSDKLMCYNNVFVDSGAATKLGDSSKTYKDVAPYILYRDQKMLSPSIFYASTTTADDKSAWTDNYYQRLMTYSGYVKNDSGSPKTIRVICTLNAYVRLTLGDSLYLSPASGDIVRSVPATPPAPHMDCEIEIPAGGCRMEIRVFDRYGNKSDGLCFGNVCIGGLENWDDAHGLMWTEQLDSKDMNDYHTFEDAGDGSFVVRIAAAPVTDVTLDSLSGNGQVDLGGATLHVGTIAGNPTVMNGNIEILGEKVLSVGRNTCFSLAGPSRADVHGLVTGMSSPVTVYESPWNSTRPYPDEPYRNMQVKDVIPAVSLSGSYADALGAFCAPVCYDGQGNRTDWTYYQRYITWSGYLWNQSDVPVTWKVVDVCNAYVWLTIGNKTCNNSSLYDSRGGGSLPGPMISDTFTLQPGPNRFVVKFLDRFGIGSMVHGNVCTNGLTGWTDGHGLMWSTNLAATDMSEFHMFEDPGDGSFFTTRHFAEGDVAVYARLTGVSGSELDLGRGGYAEVGRLSGVTRVSAGSLVVTGQWTMTRSEVEDETVFLDGVSFRAGATFDVSAEAALVKPGNSKGHLIAQNVTGDVCPALGEHLAGEGWSIALEDGEVRIIKSSGLYIIFK